MKFKLTIPGKPLGKQRPRGRNTGKFIQMYTPKETVNYESLIKLYFSNKYGHLLGQLLQGALSLRVTAYFQIPKSASKVKRTKMLTGELRPLVKPDFDNILKIIADALEKVLYNNDSQIVTSHFDKYYAEVPKVEIEIEQLPNEIVEQMQENLQIEKTDKITKLVTEYLKDKIDRDELIDGVERL
jgi:Holliday junction resolvase RusA-like endonuclease